MAIDYAKLADQIEALRKQQAKEELELIMEATARLNRVKEEADKKRREAEEAQEAAKQAHLERRKLAEEARKAEEKAEQARIRAEEHRQALAQEKRLQEEAEAAALKKKLENLQFSHEKAMQALKNTFAQAAVVEEQLAAKDIHTVVPDGTELKPVRDNTDGSLNPLDRFRQNVNS